MPEKDKSKEDTTTQSPAEQAGKEDQFRAFLVALATDPAQLGRFMKDPDATMNSAGLGVDDRAILKSGDPAAIHARLTGQATGKPVVLLVVDTTTDEAPSIRGMHAVGSSAFQQQVIHPSTGYPPSMYYLHPWPIHTPQMYYLHPWPIYTQPIGYPPSMPYPQFFPVQTPPMGYPPSMPYPQFFPVHTPPIGYPPSMYYLYPWPIH
jgi:hypothetical protein